MATTRYNDIDAKRADEEMLEKVRSALLVTAHDIATKTVLHKDNTAHADYPTAGAQLWARAVFYNPAQEAVKAFNYLLIENKDIADLATLNGVADTVVQTAVDDVVDYLIISHAARLT
jgi:hypothetical protein